MTIAQMQKVADDLDKMNLGYDQGNRWDIRKNGECDCSSSSGWIAKNGGFPVDLKGTFYTGNFVARFVGSGYFVAIPFKGLSQVKAGDFLIMPGHHVVFARTAKKFFSAEFDERGHASGGKTGDQTGREVRYRAAYVRPGGWKYIVRPISAETFEGQMLKYYATGNGSKFTVAAQKAKVRAPFDGPLFNEFVNRLVANDSGMNPAYTVNDLTVPTVNHTFVILGGTVNQMNHRLETALPAIQANAASKVIVTGGVKRGASTEAEYMQKWLTDKGVDSTRILLENAAISTIGNAKNSIALMVKKKMASYTIVSHSSHLRRATALFLAAQLKIETATNHMLVLSRTNVLAYNDKDVITKPVSATTRLEIGKEVAFVLDLSAEFAAAK